MIAGVSANGTSRRGLAGIMIDDLENEAPGVPVLDPIVTEGERVCDERPLAYA